MGKEMQFFFYQKHLKNKKGIPRREGKGVWEDYFKSQTLDQKDKACWKYIYIHSSSFYEGHGGKGQYLQWQAEFISRYMI